MHYRYLPEPVEMKVRAIALFHASHWNWAYNQKGKYIVHPVFYQSTPTLSILYGLAWFWLDG